MITVLSARQCPDQPDGIADDFDGNGIPDYYPTIYPDAYTNPNGGGQVLIPAPNWPPGIDSRFAFPFVYTNAFSTPTPPPPRWGGSTRPTPRSTRPIPRCPNYPKVFNHAPIDLGDPLGNPRRPPDLVGLPHQEGAAFAPVDRPGQASERPAHVHLGHHHRPYPVS